jgi:hypothetical protein
VRLRRVRRVGFDALRALTLLLVLLLGPAAAPAAQDADPGREEDNRIGLADLAAYRTALSGRPTADDARASDPPARVGFRDLWQRPEAYRGRRVTVHGRLERTFRQAAVGSFPPLVEAWVFSPSGDPMCVVYPRPDASGADQATGGSPSGSAHDDRRDHPASTPAAPAPGRMVRFTGTFLKMIRYAAGDGERLAPLVVGDRPPELQKAGEDKSESSATPSESGDIFRAIGGHSTGAHTRADRKSWTIGSGTLVLTLAAMVVLVIAGQQLRLARLHHLAARQHRLRERDEPDLPLQFVDSPDNVGR